MNVEIKKVSGQLMVVVDGDVWGRVCSDSHGSRGSSYYFTMTGGRRVKKTNERGVNHTPTTYSDSYERRRNPDKSIAPLNDRLLSAARELIESGNFKSPATIQAEAAAEQARHAELQRRAKSDTRTKFYIRAQTALCNLDFETRDSIIDQVIDAMEWAQSQ